MTNRAILAILLAVCPALAQKTTNISAKIDFVDQGTAIVNRFDGTATALITPLGVANLRVFVIQAIDTTLQPTGPANATLQFWFNRLDGFTMTGQFQPSGNSSVQLQCNIVGGAGKYNGATGTATLSFGPGYATIASGSGNITLSSGTTALTFGKFSGDGSTALLATDMFTGTGTVTGLGNVTATFQFGYNASAVDVSLPSEDSEATGTMSFNTKDAINFTFALNGTPAPDTQVVITGGTGAYAGATGSLTLNITGGNRIFPSVTLDGSVTQPAAGTPIITSVQTIYQTVYAANVPTGISQNAWVQINGTNLVPANTSPSGVNWSSAPSFANGQMPTQLGPLAVNVSGKNAYIYFYCSAGTDPSCATDQINVLTPLDSTVGPSSGDVSDNVDPQRYAKITVTNGNGNSSAPFVAPARVNTPSFMLFDTTGHVVATHANNSLLGPTSLYPNSSTPAKAGETIIVYGVGFGLPTTTLTSGSASQAGPLPQFPTCWVGSARATVTAANLVSPGLYAFGITIPSQAPSGDNLLACLYAGATASVTGAAGYPTAAGNLIAVQ